MALGPTSADAETQPLVADGSGEGTEVLDLGGCVEDLEALCPLGHALEHGREDHAGVRCTEARVRAVTERDMTIGSAIENQLVGPVDDVLPRGREIILEGERVGRLHHHHVPVVAFAHHGDGFLEVGETAVPVPVVGEADQVEVDVSGELDMGPVVGNSSEKPIALAALNYRATLTSPATDAEQQTLHDAVDQTCAVLNTLRLPQTVRRLS